MTNEPIGNTRKMVPLTIEQLREMDGQLAYWLEDGSWGIISVDNMGRWAGIPFFRGRSQGVNFEYDIEARGMEVYAYPPAQIDREALDPCDYCTKQNRKVYKTETYPGICDFEVFLDNGVEISVNAYNHQTPYTEEICFSFPVSYCPKCGRPLTPEAWTDLEKRLGV